MVSAGIDTVPANLVMCIAYLSSAQGQEIQKKALKLIEEVYPNGEAWEKCLVEEKVPYVTAMVKETLRFWTVIPICLPRVNIKDIPYEGAVIPAGTTFFMVGDAPAGNERSMAGHLINIIAECLERRLRQGALYRPRSLFPRAIFGRNRGRDATLRIRSWFAHVRWLASGQPGAVYCVHSTHHCL